MRYRVNMIANWRYATAKYGEQHLDGGTAYKQAGAWQNIEGIAPNKDNFSWKFSD